MEGKEEDREGQVEVEREKKVKEGAHDDEMTRHSSTDSTNSTSLIHRIASVGNWEQVHTSVLNLTFQQAKVAGAGNLSKRRSEICSRWSAP